MYQRVKMTESDRLRLCVDHIYWDLIEVNGIARGRKNELTFVTGLILHLSTITKLRMHDIAAIFDVSRSTVTDYVDFLEKRGFVRRERGAEDRRDIYVVPTEKGLEWVEHAERMTFGYVKEGMSRLTPEEQKAFLALLTRFVGNTEEPPYHKLLNRSRQGREEYGRHEHKDVRGQP